MILVRSRHSGYVIIDGEHRWRVAQELKLALVPCAIVHVTDEQARALMIKLNQIHGDWVPDLLAELASEISEPLADLGFADGELETLLHQFHELDALELPADHFDNGQSGRGESERYIGFNLSQERRELLENAIRTASSRNKDRMNPRAGCLEVILRSFIGLRDQEVISPTEYQS